MSSSRGLVVQFCTCSDITECCLFYCVFQMLSGYSPSSSHPSSPRSLASSPNSAFSVPPARKRSTGAAPVLSSAPAQHWVGRSFRHVCTNPIPRSWESKFVHVGDLYSLLIHQKTIIAKSVAPNGVRFRPTSNTRHRPPPFSAAELLEDNCMSEIRSSERGVCPRSDSNRTILLHPD